MKNITINNTEHNLSDASANFIQKYLDNMKIFIVSNSIESEVYDDIEERISERFEENIKNKKIKKITDKNAVDIVNEI